MPKWLRLLIAFGIIFGSLGFLTWLFWGWIAYWGWGANNDVIQTGQATANFSMGAALETPPAATVAHPPPPQQHHTEANKSLPVPAPPAGPPLPRVMTVWQAQNLLPSAGGQPAQKAALSDDDEESVGGTGTSKNSAFAKDMMATRVDDDRPQRRRFNPRYTLRKGQTFGCTPPMPIDTQLPGPLWCDVTEDVYGIDGTFILIPKHSTANATIEHGLGLGQDRAVLVFTDILTPGPDFLEIPLGSSQGASDLGQNGVPVDVNEHIWQKIKVALLFAGVEGLTSIGTTALESNKGNTQYNFGSMTGTGQSLASIALQHDINIPTTGYRGPGYPLKVYINHYIDLSNFYSATLTRDRAR